MTPRQRVVGVERELEPPIAIVERTSPDRFEARWQADCRQPFQEREDLVEVVFRAHGLLRPPYHFSIPQSKIIHSPKMHIKKKLERCWLARRQKCQGDGGRLTRTHQGPEGTPASAE